jgi:UrcA family protein
MESHTHIAWLTATIANQPSRIQERLMITAATKLTTFRRSLAVAGAFAALAVTATASAAPLNDGAPSITVRYDDLNLATPSGVEALYRRIASAARSVCPDEHSRELNVVAASDRCQANAVAQAVRQVNNPHLALVHASRVSHG